MSLVSVIVPVYNVEPYLPRCIDSILCQTFTDFELILVDDGSPDNCGAICDEYALVDKRVHVVHKENGGISSARNAGLDIANAEYVIFVDSDDHVADEYIANLLSSVSDLTICGMETHNANGDILRRKCYKASSFTSIADVDFAFLYQNNMMYSPYCKLFRLDIINNHQIRFPVGITWGEDGMFVANYLQYVNSLSVIAFDGYYYIKYDGQERLSTKIREDIVDTIALSREYCIEKMRNTSPRYVCSIQKICTEDIRRNCAYFLQRLLESISIDTKEQIRLLHRFMENRYAMDVILSPEAYYPGNTSIKKAFERKRAADIVKTYRKLQAKSRIFQRIYHNIYVRQPDFIKLIYRKVKKGWKHDS